MNLFKILHKFLICDVKIHNRNIVMEQSFLCANQIVVCMKFLEKTVDKEEYVGCLITSRQCFFERIMWCLARLKSTVRSANAHVLTNDHEPENFLTLLDRAFDFLSLFVGFNDAEEVSNKAEQRAELMIESREVRSAVEQLLSHALAFANVALDSDKNPITVLSQNVLKLVMDFEEEFSLSQPGKKLNESAQRMKAIELEASLCSLEGFVNNALLRLVYEVFSVKEKKKIEEIQQANGTRDLEMENFDLYVDRFLQIGHFAVWFCRDDTKVSSIIRSCLASIESIDSYLIPAITGRPDPSIDVLQLHFEEEINLLKFHVQQIVETAAFCSILMENINEAVATNRKEFKKESLIVLVQQANVLLQHLTINSKNLQLSTDKASKFYFHDFKLMLNECDAILNYPEPIEDIERRILKRFSILTSTIRKLQNAIKNNQKLCNDSEENPSSENVLKVSEFPSKCSDYFNTIRASALGSILYESKRSFKNSDKFLKSSNTVRSSKKKRNSLRITIFKKQHELEMEEEQLNDSMDLQITQILDKLNNMSSKLI